MRVRGDHLELGVLAALMALDWRLKLLLLGDRGGPAGDPTPAEARAAFNSQMRLLRPIATGNGPRLHEARALRISEAVTAMLYRPAPGVLPVILHFHGGGWVVGDLKSHQPFCRALAKATGAAVIDVDYRLAPEHPFPTPRDDCFSALTWVVSSAPALGLDASRIALIGDSAGGSLALATAMLARDRHPVSGLALSYPAVDLDFGTRSYVSYSSGYALTAQRMRWYWNQYAGPAIGPELEGLPPTLVVTAEYDVLHDEGVALHARLKASGVESELIDVPGVIHGFAVMQRLLPQARSTLASIALHLRKTLGL